MPNAEKSLPELSAACIALQQSKETLLLSTLSELQNPEISYAPYLRFSDGAFYIFISDLAAHTKNLRTNPRAAVMFISDEAQTTNLFARERLIFQCSVAVVDPDTESYQEILDAMESRFGNIMAMLQSLKDFHLFRLQPNSGSYVVGFGKAYEVDPISGQLEHISEEKLKSKKNDKDG
ncbi:MAG: HugZ family protein [Neptuniibacter sp.]